MTRSHLQHIVVYGLSVLSMLTVASPIGLAVEATPADLEKLVGQPADIASSAYQYRADRKADENPPESWFALMWYAGQPLNKPVNTQAQAIRQALCSLLWEEIRPLKTLELVWPADAKRRPAPEDLTITTLNAKCSASSWWNNLAAVKQTVKPTVTADGNTYVYNLGANTCGIVVSVAAGKSAADYDVPTLRVLTGETWKKMDVEIEWGFDPATAEKDYSGRIETYDGRVAALHPLDGDSITASANAASWRSSRRRPSNDLPSPFGRGAGGEGRGRNACPYPNPLPKGKGTASCPAGRKIDATLPGHVEMAAGAAVHEPDGRRGTNHRHLVDQGRQLLLPRRRPGKRPDPRARVRLLRPPHFRVAVAAESAAPARFH